MKDMENAVLEKDLPKEWLKQFEKKNKRRVKKGKAELSNEEFMGELVKRYDYKKLKINMITTVGLGVFGFALAIISDFITIEYDEIIGQGIIIMVGIIVVLAFCLLLAWGLARINKPACERFARMKKECDEKGWTLAEYVENMENMQSGESVISAGEEGM